jgi:hypothetical protein
MVPVGSVMYEYGDGRREILTVGSLYTPCGIYIRPDSMMRHIERCGAEQCKIVRTVSAPLVNA